MFDFHEKRKIRSIVYSRPVIAFLAIITVVLSFSVYNRYTVAKGMQDKLTERENTLNEMKQRAEALNAKVEYLQDDRGVEEELRNRFDVAREGEQVIILIDDTEQRGKGETPLPPQNEPVPDAPWYMFWR